MGMQTMQQDDSATPQGEWAHAFEEDTGDLQVFRPVASFNFAPARRGRARLRFGPGGSVTLERPGPDDRPVAVPMEALGMGRYRLQGEAGGAALVLEIVERHADRVVVRGLGG